MLEVSVPLNHISPLRGKRLLGKLQVETARAVRGKATAQIVSTARPIAPWPQQNGWKTDSGSV